MKTVSMVAFRQDAEKIIQRIQKGERLVLTYRGKPVARLEPILEAPKSTDDPFYTLYRLADAVGETLANEEMDAVIYGP